MNAKKTDPQVLLREWFDALDASGEWSSTPSALESRWVSRVQSAGTNVAEALSQALDVLPDSLNRTLGERIRLLLADRDREAKLAVRLREKLHEVAGAEVASSI